MHNYSLCSNMLAKKRNYFRQIFIFDCHIILGIHSCCFSFHGVNLISVTSSFSLLVSLFFYDNHDFMLRIFCDFVTAWQHFISFLFASSLRIIVLCIKKINIQIYVYYGNVCDIKWHSMVLLKLKWRNMNTKMQRKCERKPLWQTIRFLWLEYIECFCHKEN